MINKMLKQNKDDASVVCALSALLSEAERDSLMSISLIVSDGEPFFICLAVIYT